MPTVPLDYDLPEEMNLLRETVRKFVDKELIPVEMQTLDNGKLKPEFRISIF